VIGRVGRLEAAPPTPAPPRRVGGRAALKERRVAGRAARSVSRTSRTPHGRPPGARAGTSWARRGESGSGRSCGRPSRSVCSSRRDNPGAKPVPHEARIRSSPTLRRVGLGADLRVIAYCASSLSAACRNDTAPREDLYRPGLQHSFRLVTLRLLEGGRDARKSRAPVPALAHLRVEKPNPAPVTRW
jgi:hypothetical protein